MKHTPTSIGFQASRTSLCRQLSCRGHSLSHTIRYAGAVYVYRRSAGQWEDTPTYIKAPEPSPRSNRFGESVDLSRDGTYLATGAHYATQAGTGTVYVFTRYGDGWNATPDVLRPSNLDNNDQFGRAVSISDDGAFVVASAYGDDSSLGDTTLPPDEEAKNAGAAYVLR